MSKLANEEWISLTRKLFHYVYDGLRIGQSYMNALNDVRPDIYKKLTGTVNNPSYDDNRVVYKVFK